MAVGSSYVSWGHLWLPDGSSGAACAPPLGSIWTFLGLLSPAHEDLLVLYVSLGVLGIVWECLSAAGGVSQPVQIAAKMHT